MLVHSLFPSYFPLLPHYTLNLVSEHVIYSVTIRTRFTSSSHMTHYLTCAGTPMTHTDSGLMTHYLRIVPYDIITDVTMTHADSCLLTTYVIMTHS